MGGGRGGVMLARTSRSVQTIGRFRPGADIDVGGTRNRPGVAFAARFTQLARSAVAWAESARP